MIKKHKPKKPAKKDVGFRKCECEQVIFPEQKLCLKCERDYDIRVAYDRGLKDGTKVRLEELRGVSGSIRNALLRLDNAVLYTNNDFYLLSTKDRNRLEAFVKKYQ